MDLSKIEGEDTEVMPSIVSSVVPREEEEEEEEDYYGLAEQDVEGGLRDGRQLRGYWITATMTSTSTCNTNHIYQWKFT